MSIERLTDYSLIDARGIGNLMPMLSSRFTAEAIPEERLRRIIESPDADQLVARLNSRIVGAATLSIVYGAAMDRMAYLEDFVVDTEVRGLGIGRKLFSGAKQWVVDRDVALEFTSGDTKQAAHALYLSEGATIRKTNVFRFDSRSQ